MLKYYYTVRFQDGRIYSQNEDDVSLIDPSKSCFYDIIQETDKGNPPVIFTLEDRYNLYVVDLIDGHFEVNGCSFSIYDKPLTEPLRLIYFRQHRHLVTDGVVTDHSVIYKFGWQTTINGENIKRVMEIN